MTSHVIPMPGTGWTIWRDAVLRSAGFPAAGLDRFSAPGCAAVTDAFLGGKADRAELEEAYEAALAKASTVAAEIAADPLFREALIWQNPSVAAHIVRPWRAGDSAKRRRQRMKARENAITRYWQRYCGKNDTIGFFGPVTWATLAPAAPGVRVRCGDGLVRDRVIYYEHWALRAYVDRIAADPLIRPWLPVGSAAAYHRGRRPRADPWTGAAATDARPSRPCSPAATATRQRHMWPTGPKDARS